MHLPVGVLGETDRARLGDAFQPRGDIDAVAHQVAVALLDHVAEMDADAELDAAVRPARRRCARPWRSGPRSRSARRRRRCGTRRGAVARALDDAPVMHGDRRIDEIAAQRPQPRQGAILVRAGQPAVADHIRAPGSPQVSGSRSCRPLSSLALQPDRAAPSQHRAVKPKEDSPEQLVV